MQSLMPGSLTSGGLLKRCQEVSRGFSATACTACEGTPDIFDRCGLRSTQLKCFSSKDSTLEGVRSRHHTRCAVMQRPLTERAWPFCPDARQAMTHCTRRRQSAWWIGSGTLLRSSGDALCWAAQVCAHHGLERVVEASHHLVAFIYDESVPLSIYWYRIVFFSKLKPESTMGCLATPLHTCAGHPFLRTFLDDDCSRDVQHITYVDQAHELVTRVQVRAHSPHVTLWHHSLTPGIDSSARHP